MTDLQAFVAATYSGLADLLESAHAETWNALSLCEGWQVRHVVAHVTMPVRLTFEQFGAEMAAAKGDFTVLSNTVASRDAALPASDLLRQLRSASLHEWQPPGGGATGALSHAVIHSLDITLPLKEPAVASPEAIASVLEHLADAEGATFGIDLSGLRLETTDTDWTYGNGDDVVAADMAELVALLSGRTLPDGRNLSDG